MSDQTLPPHDPQAEMAVIGTIMLHPAMALKICTMLDPEDFYSVAHQEIFKAVLGLLGLGLDPDIIMVRDELIRENAYMKVGGTDYLETLLSAVPAIGNAPKYAEIIREKSILRQLGTESITLAADAHGGTIVASDLIGRATEYIYNCHRKLAGRKPIRTMAEIMESECLLPKRTFGTGFIEVDRRISGFVTGRLTVIAGRPSMGKTTFALQSLGNICEAGQKCVIFSIEMDEDDLRLFAERTRLPGAGNLMVKDEPDIGLRDIRAFLRSPDNVKDPVSVVVVDYLTIMRIPYEARNANRTEQIGAISRGLKQIAREHDVALVIICQMNRASENREDKRPRMSDLRDSGSIEQEADTILMMYRPGYYDPDADQTLAKVMIPKNKHGEPGIVDVHYYGGTGYGNAKGAGAYLGDTGQNLPEVRDTTAFPFGANVDSPTDHPVESEGRQPDRMQRASGET